MYVIAEISLFDKKISCAYMHTRFLFPLFRFSLFTSHLIPDTLFPHHRMSYPRKILIVARFPQHKQMLVHDQRTFAHSTSFRFCSNAGTPKASRSFSSDMTLSTAPSSNRATRGRSSSKASISCARRFAQLNSCSRSVSYFASNSAFPFALALPASFAYSLARRSASPRSAIANARRFCFGYIFSA